MMKSAVRVSLLLLLVFALHAKGMRYSPPGKPTLTRCRSPEKETFTCWWEPGFDGGLPTTYALFYRKENSETVYECPDYRTAGENSCFFNKNDTSIWVNYNITVVASNALGSTFSDPVDIDVVYIVKPNHPETVTVTVMEDKGWPFLRVSWEPPHKADTRSGWITLIYELRVKLEGENDWEMHLAGQQKIFNIFSLRSGGTYLVQVRCKPDHGYWSEWSTTSYIKVPDYFHHEKPMWVLITCFCAFIFLILTWLLHMNSQSLKHFILPPIPGPKIKGFDKQLLKNGKSDDIFSALVVPNFPPIAPSNCEDLLVEYLEVYIPEEQELMLEESKDLNDVCLKSEGCTSDSDSGRGSCDSHTLLMDKFREAKGEKKPRDQESNRTRTKNQRKGWGEEGSSCVHDDIPIISGGRVKTWPCVFSPLPQYSSSTLEHKSSLERAKQHCLSYSAGPPGSTSSCLDQQGQHCKETLRPGNWEFSLSNKQPHLPHSQTWWQLQAHSDLNISSIGCTRALAGLQLPALESTEYVEVQRVNEENMVLLQPVDSEQGHFEDCSQIPLGEDYSRVKGVDRDNRLLLQREVTREDRCLREDRDMYGESCHTSSVTQKPTACIHIARPEQDDMVLAVTGYVDTSTASTLPCY
ncbi:prolactin receptor a [Notolabrus celidotus]|uniref:prolactin receptor a n=1 Tax=Notolabrus celidotus TaxID=1203425 RepID=UPI00148F9F0E|nr:prolactin receptor a [Notolabrus celidotus]